MCSHPIKIYQAQLNSNILNFNIWAKWYILKASASKWYELSKFSTAFITTKISPTINELIVNFQLIYFDRILDNADTENIYAVKRRLLLSSSDNENQWFRKNCGWWVFKVKIQKWITQDNFATGKSQEIIKKFIPLSYTYRNSFVSNGEDSKRSIQH